MSLDHVTLEGHAGKLTRQILRRAERDGVTFRVMQPPEIASRIDELAEISAAWLRAKEVTERQFSIGYFDDTYIRRFPCAVVESREGGRLLAFAPGGFRPSVPGGRAHGRRPGVLRDPGRPLE